jgi:hypothetical protein
VENTLSTLLYLRKMISSVFLKCDSSRSARAAKPSKAAGEEKRRQTAFSAERTRHELHPNSGTRPPVTGKRTGKEFCPQQGNKQGKNSGYKYRYATLVFPIVRSDLDDCLSCPYNL